METNSFDTSFIPEQNIGGKTKRHQGEFNLPFILSLVIFFVALTVAGGLYLYRTQVLEKRIVAKRQELAEKRAVINFDKVRELDVLSTRFKLARQILDQHTSIMPLFDILSDATLVNVGYTQFSFSTNQGKPTIVLQALAPDYNAAYVQIDKLNARKPEGVRSVTLGSIASDPSSKTGDGVVRFSLTLEVDPAILKYRKYYNEKILPNRSTDGQAISDETIL